MRPAAGSSCLHLLCSPNPPFMYAHTLLYCKAKAFVLGREWLIKPETVNWWTRFFICSPPESSISVLSFREHKFSNLHRIWRYLGWLIQLDTSILHTCSRYHVGYFWAHIRFDGLNIICKSGLYLQTIYAQNDSICTEIQKDSIRFAPFQPHTTT